MTIPLWLFFICPAVCLDIVTIPTKLGDITGVNTSLLFNGNLYNYTIFKRIPYAKPPVGNLRFRKPIPFGPWNNTLDATKFGPSCIQTENPFLNKWLPNLNQSEDCLHLNVYIPANNSNTKHKSVMIWIHGGDYQTGMGMLYNGSHMAAIGDVIIVTINYRLEAFGFLSTADSLIPGNYGLWDQRLAIQWVNENIISFGGNSKSITLFGQSSGGLSVGIQAIHSKNKGLFNRVITQSGVANSIYSIKTYPRVQAKTLMQLLNCSTGTILNSSVNCLRRKSAKEIHTASENIVKQTKSLPDVHIGIPFAPVVDGDFLVDTPQNILQSNGPEIEFYKSLDVVVGNCDAEGSSMILILGPRKDINITEGITTKYLCQRIVPALSQDYYNQSKRIIPAICEKYSNNGSLYEQSEESVMFYGDVFSYSSSVANLNIHASNVVNSNSSHFHYLNKRPAKDNSAGIAWFHGASHGDELFYLFPYLISNLTADDIAFSMTIIKYWTNFAKTGDVNGHGLSYWPSYDTGRKQYALLDVNVTAQNDLYKDRVSFWLNEIPRLLHIDAVQSGFG